MNTLVKTPELIRDMDGLVYVGGFSNGDVIESSHGWYLTIKHNKGLKKELDKFMLREDTFSLGVCNGCQLMVKNKIFGDALQLKKNISNTFNAISCDSDTSTNDMVSIFSTGKSKHPKIKNANDEKIKNFDFALNKVLLNLAKRVVADGEGASKFITVNIQGCKNEDDAKKIAFSIANSPLVKTAISGEDANWGRVVMAIGKAGVQIKHEKLSIKFGEISVVSNGKLNSNYNEDEVSEYMKSDSIDINVDISCGSKSFKVYTMDLTKKYIEINGDYRS